MPIWLIILIIMCTAAGLAFAAFAMWMDFQQKQAQIGASTNELEQQVAEQQKALESAQKRIQNLEAIVTNQVWDVAREEGLLAASSRPAVPEARPQLELPDEESSDADRAAQIARRLKS